MKLYISPSTQEKNIGPNGYIEETQMNLIADILIPELIRHGQTIMRNNRLALGVTEICDESDAWGADYHIAIHSNAFNGLSRGLLVFCYDPSNAGSLGTQLARKLFARLSPLTQSIEKEESSVLSGKATMSEIAKTNAPAVLMEIDFHDTVGGAKWIMENIPNIAHAILLAILDQLGIAYIPLKITLKRGDLNANVGTWQEILNSKGYALDVDNDFGPDTETATNAHKEFIGLAKDGIVDFATLLKSYAETVKDDTFKADQAKSDIAVLNETIKTKQSELEQLRFNVSKLNDRIDSLTKENAMLERDIAELDKTLAADKQKIAADKFKIDTIDARIKQTDDQIANLNEQIAELLIK
jgi:N-acetylmuramoyl-L-alanine amidase